MLKQGVCNDQCSGLLDSPKEREMNVTIRVRLCSQPARQDKMCLLQLSGSQQMWYRSDLAHFWCILSGSQQMWYRSDLAHFWCILTALQSCYFLWPELHFKVSLASYSCRNWKLHILVSSYLVKIKLCVALIVVVHGLDYVKLLFVYIL